jgi:hypothetical protein
MERDLLPYTLSTWVFTLHVAGVLAADPRVAEACRGVRSATDSVAGNRAADALVERIRALFPDGEVSSVAAGARALYGDRVADDLGRGDSEGRTLRIRKYQFTSQLPWLARVWDRTDDGPRPTWFVVERVTEQVTAADPNPWNEVDETRRWPVHDFQVLWELDGCTSLHLRA